MALLGSSVDPRLFMQDYSGFARAAEIQAQGMQNLGASIGGAIESYAEAKEKRKKVDASTKASRAGIESAIKLGEAYGIDVKSSLEPILAKMDDPNTTPMEAAMYGEEAKNRITNVLNMGITASERESAQQRAMMEQQYKAAQLGMKAEELGLQRQKALMEAGELKETEISIFDPELNKERKEKVQIDKQGQYYDPETKRPIINKEKYFYGEEGGLGELPSTSQVGGSASDLIASAANGTFNVSYKTRDQLPKSSANNRLISLDFNAASNPNARGVEVIIPNNATPQEKAAAQRYVDKTVEMFAKYGVKVPNRGVKTAAQNKRGASGVIHLEPAFGMDKESMAILQQYPEEYAKVVSGSFSGLPVTVIPPHKQGDPGASANGITEQGLAIQRLIPAFEKLSQQGSAQANPAAIDNALAIGGDMTQQAMGTPQQQAMTAQQIEQGAGMATAQTNQGVPTEPSMTTQQPQLPQPQRRMVRGIPVGESASTKKIEIVTGPTAQALNLDPRGTYEVSREDGNITGVQTITSAPTISETVKVEASKAELDKAKAAKDISIKTISEFVDKEGKPTEALQSAVGYGEALATGIAQYAPILGTQSAKTRSDQQRLSRLVESSVLDAASLLKPVSNTDLKMLIQNRPQITDPVETWTEYFKEIRSILKDPNNYIDSVEPEKPQTATEKLRNKLQGR